MQYDDIESLKRIIVDQKVLELSDGKVEQYLIAMEAMPLDREFEFEDILEPARLLFNTVVPVEVTLMESPLVTATIRTPAPADLLYVNRWLVVNLAEPRHIYSIEASLKMCSAFTLDINGESLGLEKVAHKPIEERSDEERKELFNSRYDVLKFKNPALVDRLFKAIYDLHNYARSIKFDPAQIKKS